MLGYHIKKANSMQTAFLGPRIVVVGVPSEITAVEIKAVHDACISSGARKVFIVSEEPMAAAIGLSLPIAMTLVGSMVVDIGGGTTDIAVIALFGVVNSKSMKVAGDTFNQDIINYLKDEYKIMCWRENCRGDKDYDWNMYIPDGKLSMFARGRDMSTGLPKEIHYFRL
jgi:rod shape-determining protein MreB